MTNSLDDAAKNADLIMMVGTNAEEAHPVMGMRLRKAVERGAKLIVADPRDIRLASKADIHLKLKPGTNVAFAHGMCHVIIEEGLLNQDFIDSRCDNFEAMASMVKTYTPERVAEICEIDKDDLISAARLFASVKNASLVYCLGVTEHTHGVDGVVSLANLVLLTGNIGRPGAGLNPLRGQNNVQGACDMGAAPGDFPGYQKVDNPEVLAKFQDAWNTTLPSKPGIKATDCFPKMITKDIRGLLIIGEDPMRTDADINHVRHALESLDFMVIGELFMTETAKLADVILPMKSYAEKDGTFTNSERRVQRVRHAVSIDGDVRSDYDVFADIARRMGYNQPTLTASEIFAEAASLAPMLGGISYERLESAEVGGRGLQWPCPSADHPGTPILHTQTFPIGRAVFSTAEYRPSTESACSEYPLIMMTGRVLHHYNAAAMTDKAPGVEELGCESFIELNTLDAQDLGIIDGERVAVSSRRGSITSLARVSDKTNPGYTWMPFHYEDGNANLLTIAALDPVSSTPEFKVCAIKVEKI